MSLYTLPVELLLDVQVLALSESLPILSKHTLAIFNETSTTYRAQYLLSRHAEAQNSPRTKERDTDILTRSLRFPLSTPDVLDLVLASPRCPTSLAFRPQLPRRLFASLAPSSLPWTSNDEPLPILRYLYSLPQRPDLSTRCLRPPDANAHGGYALSRAVHAGFGPLVRLLLAGGARPDEKDALAVRIAIRRREVGMVRMLVERGEGEDVDINILKDAGKLAYGTGVIGFKDGTVGTRKGAKRRRLSDRVDVGTALLRCAVQEGARDVVAYFMDEKGVTPDLKTLQLMEARGFFTG